jgi:DUF4097 and DUF4098 domain-containing protein YvlB
MKTLTISLALGLGACSLLAQQPTPTLSCDGQHGDSRRANFCEMRESTTAAAGGVISVDAHPNGGIAVKGWNRADVLVRAQVRTTATSDAEARDLARQVTVNSTGAQIRASGPTSDSDRSWSVSFEVFVPTRSSANMQTVNGGVSVSDVTGDIEFKTVNGGVKLKGVAGNVHGNTTNGGVSIEFTGNRWEGQGMDVATTNGGVQLKVPQNFSAQLEMETTHGGLHSDLPVVSPASTGRERHVSATLGSGGPVLHFRTVNGGVSIKRL